MLAAGDFLQGWLQQCGAHTPARAALVRFWTRERLLRLPLPLTGAAPLRLGAPADPAVWTGCCLAAPADEAADSLQLLMNFERSWISARAAVAGRRRNSRAAAVCLDPGQWARRRLFGHSGMGPLREQTTPPLQARAWRSRHGTAHVPLVTPRAAIDRRQFDYSDLDQVMAQLDKQLRQTKPVLGTLARQDAAARTLPGPSRAQ